MQNLKKISRYTWGKKVLSSMSGWFMFWGKEFYNIAARKMEKSQSPALSCLVQGMVRSSVLIVIVIVILYIEIYSHILKFS